MGKIKLGDLVKSQFVEYSEFVSGIMKVNLMEICNPKQWKTIATSDLIENGKYAVYGANGIIGYYDEFNHEKPTVLITCRGATCGNIHISQPYSYINGNAMALDELNEKVCLKEYLYYYLSFYDMKQIISGSAQPQITIQGLKKVDVKLYPIEKQIEIINKLEKVKNIINNKQKQKELLEEIIKSQFVEMFGDINCNDKKLNIKKLKECCLKITDGTHDTPKKYETGKMLITGKNIRENKFDLTNIEYVSEEDHKKIYARCNPEKGDVLYTNIGVNYCTAMVNYLDFEFSMKNVALLKPNYNCIESIYLSYALNILREKITGINKCAGAQTFIGLSSISEIDVPVPKLELQNQFAEFVKLIDKQKFGLQKSLEELQKIQESLMEKYFI